MSRPKGRGGGGYRLADMSVPPDQRHRRRQTPGNGKGAAKQMNHGTGAKAEKWRRENERKDRRT